VFRSLIVALLLLALIPAAALANTSVWASRTVLDSDTFSATVGRALDTPAAESALAERLGEELFAALVRADDRVRLLLGPLVGAGVNASDREILAGLRPRILDALDDPRAEAARDELVVAVHDAFLRGVGGQGAVRLEHDRLILDVRDLLRAVLDALDPRFGQFGLSIPDTGRTEIVLAAAPGLATTRDVLSGLERLGLVLPLLALALGFAAVTIARRRGRTVRSVGLAVAIAGAAGLVLVALGGVLAGAAESSVDPVVVTSTYDALSSDLVGQSLVLLAAGAGLALVGVAAGLLPSRRSPRTVGATEPW